jgi:LPPG:FO 2-phospho-L-lactate transferase
MSHAGARSEVLAFSGGVGGAKLANGLANIVDGKSLTVVVNTGDDFEHLGLTVCPDIDSVLYALAGRNDAQRGWGRAGETWQFMHALRELTDQTWFQLGDRDLATHVYRSWRLRAGASLSAVTAEVCEKFGIRARVVPMSDDPVRTLVHTDEGVLDFQRYFVARRAEPRVAGFEFSGCERASLPAGSDAWLIPDRLAAIVICPSNPFVSIRPILAIDAWSRWLEARSCPVIAVSTFVGRQALKGPAAKMIRELGMEPTTLELVKLYGGLVDAWVVDDADAADVAAVEAAGVRCFAAATVMQEPDDQVRLARKVLEFAAIIDVTRHV